MPTRPPTFNPYPREKKRSPNYDFYRSQEWKTFSAKIRRERNNRCAIEGCDKRATHCDHITSIAREGAKLDPSNVQLLCHSHHSKKTAKVDMERGDDGLFIRQW